MRFLVYDNVTATMTSSGRHENSFLSCFEICAYTFLLINNSNYDEKNVSFKRYDVCFFLIRRPFWKYSVIRDCRGSHFGNIVFYRAMLCIRGTIAMALCPFVCLSIRLSVTSRSSTKTAKLRITHTTPHDSLGTLVFCCQRSPRNSTGVTPYEGAKCRCGGSKSLTFDK